MKRRKPTTRRRHLGGKPLVFGAVATLALLSVAPADAAGVARTGPWQPEAPVYGVSRPVTMPVTMDDGVVLSTQVVYPTDPVTGARAAGTFPVLLTQNPYGAERSNPTDAGDYFVQRGYIYVASAVRGTGASGGQVDWFGKRQGQDGAALVGWSARSLPGSDGEVGLDGCSYLGVDQWFTAAAVGRHSALKAITPFCTDSDFYNDLTGDGGIPSTFVAGIAHAEPRGPQDDPATDPQSVTIAQQATGGPRSYDDAYWQSLDVEKLMPQVVANGVPALTEAGWKDLFPGGNLGDYVAAQNAYFHRSPNSPLVAGEPVTGRYQAIVGPWTHGENVGGPELEALRLEWFDTWLKGEPTGLATTSTPLHLFENGADRWVDDAAWPPSPQAKTYYLGDGALTTGKGKDSDSLTWTASNSASALTYMTPPLTQPVVLDGPADVTVYAESTAPEVELSATLNVVAPDGSVVKQGDGVLLGSQRQIDPWKSLYGNGNTLLQPAHPFTRASQRPVTPGKTTRYDISVLANFTQIPAGDRLQLVLTSTPPAGFHSSLAPTPQELANLAGGVYTIEHSLSAPSSLNLPLTSPTAFTTSPTDWGPHT